MKTSTERYPIKYDLTNCAAEPLQFIRSCQQHAYLLVCYLEDLRLKAFSENCLERFFVNGGLRTGIKLREIIPPKTLLKIEEIIANDGYETGNPIIYNQDDNKGNLRRENLILHKSGDYLILEFEERQETINRTDFLSQLDTTLQKIQAANHTGQMLDVAVQEIKTLTGFDRVMCYQFDEDYNGTIVSEASEDYLVSYLQLRFPHTDIPEQARQLYLKQQVRQIVSTDQQAYSILISDDNELIDLSDVANRAVSPIHLEYLRNMGVSATMSVAIVMNGKLWGLMVCHHLSLKMLDYRLRNILSFFSWVLAGHLALQESTNFNMEMLRMNLIRSRLMEQMNEVVDVKGILKNERDLLELTEATGAALVLNGEYHRVGDCPQEAELKALTAFLGEQEASIYHTANLFDDFPASQNFSTRPAGLISARLSTQPVEYLMWFKPEVVETVAWGGKPTARKVIEGGRVKLHPELSFSKWEDMVSGKSSPWAAHQIDAVKALRNDIKEIILLRFQEVKRLNAQLLAAYQELESFSYTVSHDLRAPLRSIKGYAEILQEDYAELLDEYGRNALEVIIAKIGKMNQFINDILELSRLGSAKMVVGAIDLKGIIEEVWQDMLMPEGKHVRLELKLEQDIVFADYTSISQLLLNLLSNGIKYASDGPDCWIKVRSYFANGMVHLEVADNGIGFDMKYADRIFAVFNRLVSDEAYEGTGIGLALVKKIVNRHMGNIRVESEPGVGTTFFMEFPIDLAEKLPQNNV